MTVGESPLRLSVGSWFRDRPAMIRLAAGLGVLSGAVYLLVRTTTSTGIHPVLFFTLYGAELLGFGAFLVLVAGLWVVDAPAARRSPLAVPVDIILTVATDDLDHLEPALVGALSVRGLTQVRLCDEGDRVAVRELAERYGVDYFAAPEPGKANAINAVLTELTGDLLLVLDAQLVVSPDFLEALSGFFADESVSLVHCSTVRRSGEAGSPETVGFEPSTALQRVDSALWDGSAALIRRESLEAIGGMATSTSTSPLETSLLLQRAGGRLQFHPEPLVQYLDSDPAEPNPVAASVPGRRSSTRAQRIADVGVLVAALAPLQRAILLGYLIIVGIFGILPFSGFGPLVLTVWVLWVAFTWIAVVALERGNVGDTRGVVALTPALIATTLPLIVLILGLGVLAVRWVDTLARFLGAPGFLPPLEPITNLCLTIIGVVSLIILIRFLSGRRREPAQRRLWRFTVDLAAQVDDTSARCVDLHQSGASFLLPRASVEPGDGVPVAIEVRALDGTFTTATGRLRVTSVRAATHAGSTVRVGGPIEWDSRESRAAVIEHCFVVEPYDARTRSSERATRLPVDLPARVGGLAARCVDMSHDGAAFVVPESTWRVGETIVAEVRLLDGSLAQGFIDIRSVQPAGDGRVRLGGSASWNDPRWLSGYASVHPDGRPD